jgi:hypothetical protein
MEGFEFMMGDGPVSSSMQDDVSGIDKIGRYFVHGLVFSILMRASTVVLAAILVMLILFASFLGFIIWFAVVFMVWGLVNAKLCSWLWHFDVRMYWTSLLGHGFVLFIVLLILELPVTFLGIGMSIGGITPAVLFIAEIVAYSFIDGFVGKNIGGMFAERHISIARRQLSRTPTAPLTNCPYCGAVFPYREIDLTREGTASCRQCGATIQDPRFQPGGPRRPTSGSQRSGNRTGPNTQW